MKRIKSLFFFFFLLFLTISEQKIVNAIELGRGEQIFYANCTACHLGGNNIIIPEKNLKKDALEANGMNNINAITYQVMNGKNGMPAFGGRLTEEEIKIVSSYVIKQSLTNFQEP
jgi:cytochrome c6